MWWVDYSATSASASRYHQLDMATKQKNKRQTKHRGNVLGQVEARGSTSKRPGDEKGQKRKQSASERQVARLNTPPTWRGAAGRAAIAAAIFFVAIILIFKEPVDKAAPLAIIMLGLYVPMSYMTDKALYNRRQRKKQLGGKK